MLGRVTVEINLFPLPFYRTEIVKAGMDGNLDREDSYLLVFVVSLAGDGY